MNSDDFTRPEHAAQIRQAKRYKRAIETRGVCCACKHRDRTETLSGRNVCRVGQQRMHPQCEKDG